MKDETVLICLYGRLLPIPDTLTKNRSYCIFFVQCEMELAYIWLNLTFDAGKGWRQFAQWISEREPKSSECPKTFISQLRKNKLQGNENNRDKNVSRWNLLYIVGKWN